MRFNRIALVALTLCLAALMLAGSAWAGTTSIAAVTTFARESAAANTIYTTPGAANSGTTIIKRLSNIIPAQGTTVRLDLTLSGSALYTGGAGHLPQASNVVVTDTVTGIGVPASSITLINSPSANSLAQWTVTVTTNFTGFMNIWIDTSGWDFKDVTNALGSGSLTLQLATFDYTGTAIDAASTDTKTWVTSAFALATPTNVAGAAKIDVGTNRVNFVAGTNVTTTADSTPTFGINSTGTGPLYMDGSGAFSLKATDKVRFTVTGDLTNVKNINWGGSSYSLAASDQVTNNTTGITLDVAGTAAALTGGQFPFTVTIDGLSTLNTRTLSVAVKIILAANTLTNATTSAINLPQTLSTSTLTVWSLNGTVLVAPWLTGNTNVFSSRIYVYNGSTVSGDVTVTVYTLKAATSGSPGSFTASSSLGTVDLGNIQSATAAVIKLEDILTTLGVALPYTTNNGNLAVVLTVNISSSKIVGIAQVFSLSMAYGTYSLLTIQ